MKSRDHVWKLATLLGTMSLLALFSCQRSKVAVETHTIRNPDWDSGLSVEMKIDDSAAGDSVLVSAVATATNTMKKVRELCVNLHFVANFKEAQDSPQRADSLDDASREEDDSDGVHEIAQSPWKKDGKTNCTSRSLEPGESFQESFSFKYSKAEFAKARGDITVTCEIWFQTRTDIPNRSLTCDMEHYAYEEVRVRTK